MKKTIIKKVVLGMTLMFLSFGGGAGIAALTSGSTLTAKTVASTASKTTSNNSSSILGAISGVSSGGSQVNPGGAPPMN